MESETKNRVLTCVDCNESFIFSAGEQIFFKERQFVNDPKRCKLCKAKRNDKSARALRETHVLCGQCNEPTTVPFRPNQGRPVLCRACFQTQAKIPGALPAMRPLAPTVRMESNAAERHVSYPTDNVA